MFLVNDLIALLASNLVLMQALGTSTLFIAAGSRRNLIGTASVITIFTTIGSIAAYFINEITADKFSDFTLFFYVLAVGILYIVLLTVLYFFNKNLFVRFKKYIHLSAFNCAVMGTLFTIREDAFTSAKHPEIINYLSCGFEAGIGFVVAALFLTAAFDKLNSSKVPSSFRGFPAMLIYLGIISMAIYSLK